MESERNVLTLLCLTVAAALLYVGIALAAELRATRRAASRVALALIVAALLVGAAYLARGRTSGKTLT